MLGPRLNPLTKFPLHVAPPGHANLASPTVAVHTEPVGASIIGPVSMGLKFPVTPVSWATTPYLNKAPASQPVANNSGGLRR